jgi:hypothetical protein
VITWTLIGSHPCRSIGTNENVSTTGRDANLPRRNK